MDDALPLIYLARHGETAWSRTGQHTGRTDLPLTELGEREARLLGARLQRMTFAHVLCSPLQRAHRTCVLAGLGDCAELDADLVEWDYGRYEGLRSDEIRQQHPNWEIFRDGCPGGETLAEVAERADRVVARLLAIEGRGLVFSSGHLLKVLAARWLGYEPELGRGFALSTASLGALGYEGSRERRVVRLWNDTEHLTT